VCACLLQVLAPRAPTQFASWHPKLTYVQLVYTFVLHEPFTLRGAPVRLSRSFLSFYDFDLAPASDLSAPNDAGLVARECVAIRGAHVLQTANETQITRHDNLSSLVASSMSQADAAEVAEAWRAANGTAWEAQTLFCGSQPGSGADNPLNPATMTGFERSRALMAELVDTSSLLVRHVIAGCCSTGRNFLIGARVCTDRTHITVPCALNHAARLLWLLAA
jgi:hypothetical protein